MLGLRGPAAGGGYRRACFGYDKFAMTSDIQEEMLRRQLGFLGGS